jgi:hypothetical protein
VRLRRAATASRGPLNADVRCHLVTIHRGHGAATLPGLSVLPARPPYTYIGVADALLPGVQLLIAAQSPPAMAISMLAAHTLECLLKAFLSRSGSDDELKSKGLRHNLVALWQRAASEGLQIPDAPPHWVQRLGELHDSPYYLRYSTGVHGIVLPPLDSIMSGLVDLHATVAKSIERRES